MNSNNDNNNNNNNNNSNNVINFDDVIKFSILVRPKKNFFFVPEILSYYKILQNENMNQGILKIYTPKCAQLNFSFVKSLFNNK